MVPKHGDLQKIIRDGSKLQRWMPWESPRISRKERIRNVTIRQQIGRKETIIKKIEQNQLTWYGHVQRMAEGRLPKIALKRIPKQKRARGRLKKNWMEGIRKAMNERILNEGQWEDRKQWSLGVGQRRKTFWNRYIDRLTISFSTTCFGAYCTINTCISLYMCIFWCTEDIIYETKHEMESFKNDIVFNVHGSVHRSIIPLLIPTWYTIFYINYIKFT